MNSIYIIFFNCQNNSIINTAIYNVYYICLVLFMKNFEKLFKNESFSISLIFLLAFSRLIPHPPNFTPIIALAIMSGYIFKNLNNITQNLLI